MLDYIKTILQKVSFDARLFEKELRKAIKTLLASEIDELKNWCYTHFSLKYPRILGRCFA
ncbi:MAG: hypothetical protein OEX02_03990 [Cyclobacteriaceae bacterium]|nr:hypothetical protein [Cyclobacteriaceae bacterium]